VEFALVGTPYAGKSTVFDLLAANQSVSPPHGLGLRRLTLKLLDPRLDALAALFKPEKTTPISVSILDPAPQGAEDAKGRAGRADPFSAMRAADALILVIRAFDAPQVPHPAGSVDPLRDISVMTSEMMLADLVVIEGRLERIKRMAKVGKPAENPLELPLLERCREALEAEKSLGDMDLRQDELKVLSGFALMTVKPMLTVLNVGERPPGEESGADRREALIAEVSAKSPDTWPVAICASLELELAGLDPQEAREFMEAEGIGKLGGERILELALKVAGRITFFTVLGKEIRAWALPKGSTALQAAGAVHSDMEKGFIKAETTSWGELVDSGSPAGAREKGLMRLEGRDYVVQDGDVLTIRFSS
jgi:GTP-binding protein YchF